MDGLFGEIRWSTGELAEVLRLTPQRIGQLVREGILPQPVNCTHHPKAAVTAYLAYVESRQIDEEREKEEAEKLRLDNALKRLRLERATGELMSREAVSKAWFAAGRQIRDTLQSLPDRLAGPLATETDPSAVFALISKGLQYVLEDLSRIPDVKTRHSLAAV